jgi:transcriptional regulator with XRE-family HTH domain
MAGHSRWRTLQAKRLAETGDVREHPEYEQAGRDLRLGDQLRAIRRSRNLTQKEVAERAGISQPALSRIELGGGVPDIETLRRLGKAMGVRFHVIVGNEEADHDENLLVSLAKPRLAGTSTEASRNAHNDSQLGGYALGGKRSQLRSRPLVLALTPRRQPAPLSPIRSRPPDPMAAHHWGAKRGAINGRHRATRSHAGRSIQGLELLSSNIGRRRPIVAASFA